MEVLDKKGKRGEKSVGGIKQTVPSCGCSFENPSTEVSKSCSVLN